VEGSLPNKLSSVQATGHVLWSHQQSSYLPDLDEQIFQDLITEGVLSVYLNEIPILTSSIKEHQCITQLVLDQMYEHKLYLQPKKCEFKKTRIKYLGIIILHNMVEMDHLTRRRCSPSLDLSTSTINLSLCSPQNPTQLLWASGMLM
jgi:hypothetical protein